MRTRNKWIMTSVVGFIVAVLFGAQGPLGGFWGAETSDTEPAGAALAGLIGAGLIEAIAFGVGLAWIAFGWSIVKTVDRPLALATYAAVAWGLISWAPHTGFHQSLGEDNWGGLAGIEWGFHVTLVFSAFIVAVFIWRLFNDIASSTDTSGEAQASQAQRDLLGQGT